MPPEVRVALEEQSYQCVDGGTSVKFPESIADIAVDFSDSIAGSCTGMTITAAADGETANLEISDNGVFACQPFLTVPFALDGAVIVISQADLSSLTRDLATASKIFDGTITAWNDPAIAALNPDGALPEAPISVFKSIQQQSLDSLKLWAKELGATLTGKLLQPVANISVDEASSIGDNQIAILPYSVNMQTAFLTASIVTDAKNLNDPALSDAANFASAGTQWVAKAAANSVGVSLDFKRKPTPPEGSDLAPAPYQGIYPIYMALCGSDNLTTRAAARFLLRQDSQGSLGASNLLPLPETIRIASIEPVAKGLPKVKITEPAE
jgi:phosphate transport system substrate-binding protein